jgi:hypothetical protein
VIADKSKAVWGECWGPNIGMRRGIRAPLRGEDMKKNKSSISKAQSYAEIGEFWDKHDLSEFWDETRKAKFDVVLEPEATYYPIGKDLAEKINSVARKEGVTSGTLVNRWLGQKLKDRRRRTGKLTSKNP